MSTAQRKGASGRKVNATAPTAGYSSGDLVPLRTGTSGWVGEALVDASSGETCTLEVGHEAYITKNTGTGESFSLGDKVYRDASTGVATPTATGNDYIGSATAAAGVSATAVWVQFAPTGG